MYIELLDLNDSKEKQKLSEFLFSFGLQLDLIDEAYILYDQDVWIGCGCRHQNVLKNFAIIESYQSQQLLPLLLQHVKEAAFNLGFTKTFIYTPILNKALFESLYYRLLVEDESVCLLENGVPSFEEVLNTYDVISRGCVGAIVVNANPFTLGHQYLIETASKQVDALDVFVLEEDASLFSYTTRLELVRQGTSHLKNIEVLPSSEYMISKATFPTYFLKDEKLVNIHHAQLDALLFASSFVKKRKISIRFFGEEPTDITTRNYMEVCAKILPAKGCDVSIIPRKEVNGQIISATKVRKAWRIKDWVTLQQLVPETTWTYLKTHEHP